MRKSIPLTMTAMAALALGACADADDEAEVVETDSEMMAEPVEAADDFTLSDEQRARRDAADMATLETEVSGYYEDTADWPEAGADWRMADLDRNSDGRLSPSEFAVYHIEAGRAGPRPSTAPYYGREQLGMAADRFYYFDEDGDDFISDAEFRNAGDRMRRGMSRMGERADNGMMRMDDDPMNADPMNESDADMSDMDSGMTGDRPSN